MPCSLLDALLFLRNLLCLWWQQLVLPNHLYISVRWHCITCQATVVCIGTTMRTSDFTNFCESHCLVDFRLLPLSRWDLCSSGCYTAYNGNSLPLFWDNLSVLLSRVNNPRILGFLTLEDGTDSLSHNAGKELPLYAV